METSLRHTVSDSEQNKNPKWRFGKFRIVNSAVDELNSIIYCMVNSYGLRNANGLIRAVSVRFVVVLVRCRVCSGANRVSVAL